MVIRNQNLSKLHSGYLFLEIAKRKKAFLEKNPNAKLISLGIGDTTEPIPYPIAKGLKEKAESLMTVEGYQGYGWEQGQQPLREKIASRLYHGKVDADEVFVSDGSKCDIGRLQLMFGSRSTTAVQDPTYPAYVDTGVIVGQTGPYNKEEAHYTGIRYMRCTPENNFFPNLDALQKADLIYFCSPNNPTGVASTHDQLKQLVAYAKRNNSIIIYDAAYAIYIQDPSLPRSIYEIEGAKDVAIELGSFSKMAGFTGVRLGWTVIPKQLHYEDGHNVHHDWSRINSTFFNGASNISQAGGMAALDPEGWQAMHTITRFYLENAALLRKAIESLKFPVYGGIHAPYIWVKFPHKSSWEAFEDLLENAQILSTPGCGFGPAGEGFIRFSAFGHRPTIEEAARRLRNL